MSPLPCPFVQPEVVRLQLPSGHYLDVKRELNAGERRRVFAGMVKNGAMVSGEVAQLDPERVGLTRIMAYLVGWSFADIEGHPVPISEAAVDNLTTEDFNAVAEAIDTHEQEERARREEARKNRDGASGLRAIS